MSILYHDHYGEGTLIKQDGKYFHFKFGNLTKILVFTEKYPPDKVKTDDEILMTAIIEEYEKSLPKLPKENKILYKTLPLCTNPYYRRKLDDSTFLRIADKIFHWKKGSRYQGVNYTDMVNTAMGTKMDSFRRATYDMGAFISNCEALFVFFDGRFRDNGSLGYFMNAFINEDTILETCHITNLKEYEKSYTINPDVRFIFKRDPDMTDNCYLCELIGIFKCVKKEIYLIDNTRYQGEIRYERYTEFEKLWREKVNEANK